MSSIDSIIKIYSSLFADKSMSEGDTKDLLIKFYSRIADEHHKRIEKMEATDAYDNGIPLSDLFENEILNPLEFPYSR